MNFPVNWEEIELSESYLVSCMFEEAASLSYSTLKRLCNCKFEESVDKDMVEDMIECSGMVLLQAYKELGRTQSILKELETLFGSIIFVPVPLLLTGVCFLMSEKCLSGLQETLEVFLSSWNYVEQKPCYILRTVDKQQISFEGHICYSLPVEKYVEVAKVYVISLLGVVLDNYELANAQLTKANLPEEERQALLEQLQCACVRTNSNSNSLLDPKKPQSVGRSDLAVSSTNTSPCEDRSTRTTETISHDVKLEGSRSLYPSLGRLFKAFRSFFLFFRAITLKLGSAHLVISHGRVMLVGAFTFAALYIVQKKRDTFKRFAARQISGIKNAALDAWRLAFSMQVVSAAEDPKHIWLPSIRTTIDMVGLDIIGKNQIHN